MDQPVRFYTLFAAINLFCASVGQATANTPFYIKAELEDGQTLHQHSIRRQNGVLEFGLNSNFLCGQFSSARIGRFKLKNRREYATLLDALEKAAQRTEDQRSHKSQNTKHHQISWFIKRRDVTDNRGYANLVRLTLERTCLDEEVIPLHSVSGELRKGIIRLRYYEAGKVIKEVGRTLGDLKCSLLAHSVATESRLYVCDIPVFGKITLLEPKQ